MSNVLRINPDRWYVGLFGRSFRVIELHDSRLEVSVESNGVFRSDIVSADDRMAVLLTVFPVGHQYGSQS
jgi:hypothetical protein